MKWVRLGICASIVLLSGWAEANIGASQRRPAEWSGPLTELQTPLVVQAEKLLIDCRESPATEVPVCDFEALYTIHNPTKTPQTVAAAFYGIATRGVRLEIDGQKAGAALSEAESRTLDALVAAAETGTSPIKGIAPAGVAEGTVRKTGFVLSAAPGQTLIVRASGLIDPGQFYRPLSNIVPPAAARHRLLGTRPQETTWDLDYLLAPIKTWGGTGPIEVEIRYPIRWRLRSALSQPNQLKDVPIEWERVSAHRTIVERVTLNADSGARLSLSWTVPAIGISHGGPLLGLGLFFGRERPVRGRFSWEFSSPYWMLLEFGLETDFEGALYQSSLFKAALPEVYVIPSISLGTGAVLELNGNRDDGWEIGWRSQLDALYHGAGLALTVDVTNRATRTSMWFIFGL